MTVEKINRRQRLRKKLGRQRNVGFFTVTEMTTATLRKALVDPKTPREDRNQIYAWLHWRRWLTQWKRQPNHPTVRGVSAFHGRP